jgi:hypothetical protein
MKNNKKLIIVFSPSDLHFREYKKDKCKKALEVLNSLTEEQKAAVELFGDSRYETGRDDEAENYCD